MDTDVTLRETPDGRRIEVSGVLAARAPAVWDLLVEPARWPDWGPSVRAVDCPDERIETGTTGRVKVPGGFWIPFEIDACDHDRRRWTWSVAGIPATGHRVEAVDDDRTRVVFEVPVLAAGYVPVCQRAIRRIADLLAAEP